MAMGMFATFPRTNSGGDNEVVVIAFWNGGIQAKTFDDDDDDNDGDEEDIIGSSTKPDESTPKGAGNGWFVDAERRVSMKFDDDDDTDVVVVVTIEDCVVNISDTGMAFWATHAARNVLADVVVEAVPLCLVREGWDENMVVLRGVTRL